MTSNGQDTSPPPRTKIPRVLAIGACVLVALPLVGSAALLGCLAFGPLDITPVVRPFLPITIIKGEHGHPPEVSLRLGHAELRWNGLREGVGTPITVVLQDMRFIAPDNATPNTVQEADITLDPLTLLHGSIKLRTVSIKGVHLALRRTQNGSVGFDLDLAPTPQTHDDSTLETYGLENVHIEDATISMDDRLTGTHWLASNIGVDLHLHRMGGASGVTGLVKLSLAPQGTPGPRLDLSAHGEPADNNRQIIWHLNTNTLNPATFAPLYPQLAKIDTPLSFAAETHFIATSKTDWMLPSALNLTATLGAGHVLAGGSRYEVDHGSAMIGLQLDQTQADTTPAKINIPSITLFLRNPGLPEDATRALTLTLTGALSASDLVQPKGINAQLTATIPHVSFEDLVHYWPNLAAKGGKKWVTENITTGMATNLVTTATLDSKEGWSGLKLTNIQGGIDATGLTVHWLRPITPLQGLDARLDIVSPDKLSIHFDHGYQLVNLADKNVGLTGTGRIEAGPGSMDIVGLTQKDQVGIIQSDLRGRLQDVMALLAEPRLHLLSRHPLSLTKPRGKAGLHLGLSLPLISRVSINDMTIQSHADVSHASIGNVVAGRDVANARFGLDVTTDGLSLAGHGVIGGLPSDLTYAMDFRSLPPDAVSEKAHLTSRITPDTALAAGITTGEHFAGSADLAVDYQQLASHKGTVNLNLDLLRSNIHIPMWDKAAGKPAQASATLDLDKGQITNVERLRASGPDMNVVGTAQLRAGHAPELLISSFKIARSNGHARLVLPQNQSGNMIHVGVYADTLDLSPLVSHDEHEQTAPAAKKPANYHVPEAATGKLHGPPGTAWAIDLTANQLWYSKSKQPLRTVKAYFEDNGLRLEKMRFTMQGPVLASMTLNPTGANRTLQAHIPDMGAFLGAFGILPDVKGGQAKLEGTFDDTLPAAPFSGKLSVTPFTLKKAPTSLQVARNISLYGWLNAQNANDFQVTHMNMPVTFEDGVLEIHDGTTGNGALGATLEGKINLDRNSIDLHGTVVPIFAVNTLPGKLPGIGKLFSPEKNGGLLAVTFGVTGKLEDPTLHINPYSIFLPGVLREMF
ncbi:AsmA-like C-terminal region-containing protein [Acetobacter syzygii]|uniref:AsmA-like C-terminal region-containing protein n=1 Tax=Acetobacter syzygii TaxID=146476 RepID=UPI000662A90A|nr:AsmA-like C-terminal region-containing protein [Acetobacter syzygii]